MTNEELIAKMGAMTEIFRKHPDLSLSPSLTCYVNSKDVLRTAIKTIGGRWNKTESSYGGEYQTLTFTHQQSGLELRIDRDKVCRKIVKYECEPVMSPEEEAELLTEVTA